MQIKEVEKQLSMSAHTLRYYEKMNLVIPERDENGYRNYSQQDLLVLKKIRFLRALDIPIEEISKILNDTAYFHEILESHLVSLNEQITSLTDIREICEELKEKEIPVLDGLTDQQITKTENSQDSFLRRTVKSIRLMMKPSKTIVLGNRVDRSALFKKAVGWSFVYFFLAIFLSFFLGGHLLPALLMIMPVAFFKMKPQDYIELTDEALYLCREKDQSAQDMYLAVLKGTERQHNRRYEWSALEKVKIELYTGVIRAKGGIYRIYRLDFSFYFKDGETYKVETCNSKEQIRTSYGILKNKQIPIDATDEIIGYFSQETLSQFDYFENIYHFNYPAQK